MMPEGFDGICTGLLVSLWGKESGRKYVGWFKGPLFWESCASVAMLLTFSASANVALNVLVKKSWFTTPTPPKTTMAMMKNTMVLVLPPVALPAIPELIEGLPLGKAWSVAEEEEDDLLLCSFDGVMCDGGRPLSPPLLALMVREV